MLKNTLSSLIQTILSVPDSHRISCLRRSRTFWHSLIARSPSVGNLRYRITLPRRIPYLFYMSILCICLSLVNINF